MKRCFRLLVVLSFMLVGCSSGSDGSSVDIDFTQLSAPMQYAEAGSILESPEQFVGKTMRVRGVFQTYRDPVTSNDYYFVGVRDVSICCVQYMEFKGSVVRDYPEPEREIEVTGTWGSYQEGNSLYYYLLVDDIK